MPEPPNQLPHPFDHTRRQPIRLFQGFGRERHGRHTGSIRCDCKRVNFLEAATRRAAGPVLRGMVPIGSGSGGLNAGGKSQSATARVTGRNPVSHPWAG